MRERFLFGGDLHKRPVDISSISGYVSACNQVQVNLMKDIIKHNITHFISLGDWYDKGYVSDIPAALADTDMDEAMASLLNGNFYGVVGNHIKLQLDSNPELHLIQPHPIYKSRKSFKAEQTIRTPDIIEASNGLQISLMHYVDTADVNVYKPVRKDGTKFHVAVFHTPLIIPNDKLPTNIFHKGLTSNEQIEKVLRGVDLAIVGDIHKPIPPFPVNHPDGSTTTMVVPGSLTNTNSSNMHSMINAPLITSDESGIRVEYLPIDLCTNMITVNVAKKVDSEEKLKTFRGKASNVVKDRDGNELIVNSSTIGSLSDFLEGQGLGGRMNKELILALRSNPGDIFNLATIFSNYNKSKVINGRLL